MRVEKPVGSLKEIARRQKDETFHLRDLHPLHRRRVHHRHRHGRTSLAPFAKISTTVRTSTA